MNTQILNWENYLEGYFVRNALETSAVLLADIELSKNFKLDLGGGYQYRLIEKTPIFYFPEKYIHQHGWTLNLGVKYMFRK